jgi:hypothetical protein
MVKRPHPGPYIILSSPHCSCGNIKVIILLRIMVSIGPDTAVLEPSKTGTYITYPYRGDAYQYTLPKTGTYVKYPYRRLHGSSTLVTLPT